MAIMTAAGKLFRGGSNISGLHVAAFLYSSAWGVLFVALPFVITSLGGSDEAVGLCFAVSFAAYVVACSLTRLVVDRFSPRSVLLAGTCGTALAGGGIYVVVLLQQTRSVPFGALGAVTILMGFAGLTTSLFWPPLMGWVSTGHEGPSLSRRLAVFNFSWAAAMVISPFFGGYLVEISCSLPLIVATVLFAAAVLAIAIVRPADANRTAAKPAARLSGQSRCIGMPVPVLPTFRWIARIGLVTGSAGLVLVRTQTALLFKLNLGFSESHFGHAIACMSLAVALVLTVAGKTPICRGWHNRFSPFVAAQLLIGAGMLVMAFSSTLGWLYAAPAMIGLGQAFIYSAHQYYGVSGGLKRSGLMAIHEIAVSSGYFIGSVLGGFVSGHLGRRSPYWFGFAMTAASFAAQLVLWLRLRARQKESSSYE